KEGFSLNKIITNPIPANEINIKAPVEFDNLILENAKKGDNNTEFNNKFAIPKWINIDFLKVAKVIELDNYLYYHLIITTDNTLNISLQFKEFHLSENSILSIYTETELTDSITANENNGNNIWATRVYQGHKLNLVLKMPVAEKSLSSLKISQLNFGYKKYGGDYFGSPGASASCNINVQCPQGSTWQNERNAVVLMLVADGAESCTGSMITNTCNSNIPYVLTANHCLTGNLNNWVFQYQYFSTSCNSNTGGREDIQFNGCTLKANSANSDFALVKMNQIPSVSTGISYAGWNRNSTPATSTTQIHHPAADLMKISLDANSVVQTTWPGTSGFTHWKAHFQEGTVEPGSSGSPLFDQNHRVIGQCHGDQNNAGNYCTQRISECGRFDVSWIGGGTDATRLSNWLDPTGTNAFTTNTTNISNLNSVDPNSYQIVGPSQFCTSQTYSISNLPSGATVSWYITPEPYFSYTQSNNVLTVNRIDDGDVNITASVTICGITLPQYLKTVRIGGNPIIITSNQTACNATDFSAVGAATGATFNWSSANGTILYNGTSTTSTTSSSYISATTSVGNVDIAVVNTNNSCFQSVFISKQLQYTYPRQIDGVLDTYSNGDQIYASVNTTSFDSYYTWYVNGVVDYEGTNATDYSTTYSGVGRNIVCGENTLSVEVTTCGFVSSSSSVSFYKTGNCYFRGIVTNVNVFPNPAKDIVNIRLKKVKNLLQNQKNIENIREIRILNKFGKVVKVFNFPLDTKLTTINIGSLPFDIYFIEVSDIKNKAILQLSIQK
ncbi:MAG: hypothetical protein JWQ25_1681, partial [Daejeonella sp.]|nr:hypothetical protein [Daejeonella sp.]